MKQQTQILIIGQGLCGSWLSYFLQKEGIDCIVIDDGKEITSSKIASGIINPVTGRRHVKTWMIETIMPFAMKAYKEFEPNCISQKNVLDFFPSLQMEASFLKRVKEQANYLTINQNNFNNIFNYDFSIGEINPCWLINVNMFLQKQQTQIKTDNRFLQEKFDINFLQINSDKIIYKNITTCKIIFCDGVASLQNKYFSHLPFVQSKGEALIIECNDLPNNYIYKNGKSIVPWNNNLFWVGSNYAWDFKDHTPTISFKKEIEIWLNQFLKLPYKIINHVASIRPATNQRRPFVGLHPNNKNIGILNGMGTKGVSLAPYFANELVQHLKYSTAINEEASIERFA